jgi:hypothetical protein
MDIDAFDFSRHFSNYSGLQFSTTVWFSSINSSWKVQLKLTLMLRHRAETSRTIFLVVAGALRGCPPLAVLVLRRGVRPHIASRYDRQIARLVPARRLAHR